MTIFSNLKLIVIHSAAIKAIGESMEVNSMVGRIHFLEVNDLFPSTQFDFEVKFYVI